jgi:hypothetical protein
MKHFTSAVCLIFLMFCTGYAQEQTVGLFENDSLSFNGYSLLAPSVSKQIFLLDNCGRVVHQWESDFFPGMVTYLLPDGNLLRACRIQNTTFFGGGSGGRLELLDWDSNVIWSYQYSSSMHHQHHDLEFLPNGNILVLAWEFRSEVEALEAGRNPDVLQNSVWPEQIVELKPVGTNGVEIVWIWRAWDHLVQDFDPTKENYGVVSAHPELIDLNFTGPSNLGSSNPDWIHANSIAYNAELDQIIINSRNFQEFWVIDHSTTIAEAAAHEGGNSGKGGDLLYRWGNPRTYQRGDFDDQVFFVQHDAHWIPEGYPGAGNIMVFNNGLGRPDGNYSSVDVLKPPMDMDGQYIIDPEEAYGPDEFDWQYVANPPEDLFSSNISGAQRLPNGNTLICEGNQGTFIEVDEEGQQHWLYVSPISQGTSIPQGQNPAQNSVFRMHRYGPDYPAFTGKILEPGDPIELDPFPSDCIIYGEPVSVVESNYSKPVIHAFPNPFSDHLSIEFADPFLHQVEILDALGRRVYSSLTAQSILELGTANWSPGLYLLRVREEKAAGWSIQKIIKQ